MGFLSVSSWVFYRFHHLFFLPILGLISDLFGPLFASFMEIDQKIEKMKENIGFYRFLIGFFIGFIIVFYRFHQGL